MKTNLFKVPLELVFILMGTWVTVTHAQQVRSISPDFNSLYRVQGTTLALSGVGQLRYLGFIRIYDGALYLPNSAAKNKALSDIPKRLEVKYLRSFKADDFGSATIAGIKKNVDAQTYAQLESRIKYHNTLYDDVVTDDRVSLTYHPAMGTQVEINGITKGTVEGADFAAALFSLWLGDKPFDEGFKRSLLGQKR